MPKPIVVVGILVVAGILIGVAVFAAAGRDPERNMNECDSPVGWTKAEGSFSFSFTVGAPSGSFDGIEVHTADDDYDSGWSPWSGLGQAIAGKAGNVWVTSYATGPDGIVTPQRDSEPTPYEVGLETAYSGNFKGTFRTGDVCVESHGVVTWTFILKQQNNREDNIQTLATESRDATI